MKAMPETGASLRLYYLFLLCMSVLVFGVNWPVMKAGLSYVDPLWMGAIRLISASAMVVVINLMIGQLALPQRHDWSIVAFVGLLHFSAMPVLAGISVHLSSPPVAAACLYSTPFWLFLIAALRDGLPRDGYGAIAAVLVGLATMAWSGSPDKVSSDYVYGVITGLAGSCCTALSIDFIRRYKRPIDPLRLLPWQLIVAGVPTFLLAVIAKGAPPDGLLEWRPMGLLFFTGPLTTGFAAWALIVASRGLPSLLVGSVAALTPAIGLIATNVLEDRSFQIAPVLGVVLILVGALWQIVDSGKRIQNKAP